MQDLTRARHRLSTALHSLESARHDFEAEGDFVFAVLLAEAQQSIEYAFDQISEVITKQAAERNKVINERTEDVA